MTLTDLQRDRIDYHLDLDSSRSLLSVSYDIRYSTLDPNRELAIIGNLSNAPATDIYQFMGQDLATNGSILGRCERALDSLDPSTIDDSLLAKSAGKVTLRQDELTARTRLYKATVKQLKQAMGYTDFQSGRAGILW